MMIKIKDYIHKIQSCNINKKIQNLIIIGLLGVAFILAGSFFFGESDKKEVKPQEDLPQVLQDTGYETKIKSELKEILQAIDGVGNVDVMITIANDSESKIAYSTTESQNTTQEKDNQGGQRMNDQNNVTETAIMVSQNGESTPFVTRENRPEIKGVIVVAGGADNADIKYQLDQAVQTALDLPSHKVVIYARKK